MSTSTSSASGSTVTVGRRRVDATLALGHGHALHAVRTALVLHARSTRRRPSSRNVTVVEARPWSDWLLLEQLRASSPR